jgi:hypothetical protein
MTNNNQKYLTAVNTPPSLAPDQPPQAAHYAQRLARLGGDVAGFALLRMATLPYRMLDALRLPATEKLIQDIFHAQTVMAAHSEALGDALFAAVAALDEDAKTLRRMLLQLRREIHAGSSTRLRDPQLDMIAPLLSGDAANRFTAWRAAQAQLAQASSDAETSFHTELQTHVRPALRAPIKYRLFYSALALASTGVALTAQRERRLPTKPEPDNYERSLFGYVVRAAAKTSPFSSFMASSAVAISLGGESALPVVEDRDMHRRVRLNRGMVARLTRMVTRVAVKAGETALHINPTLAGIGNNRYRALCERDIILLGRPWREQRRTQFALHPNVCAVLDAPTRQKNLADWRASFVAAGISTEQVDGLIDKLCERGVFQWQSLSDSFDPQPETALLKFLQNSPNERLVQSCELISKMDQLCRQLVADDSAGRVGAVEQIRAAEQQIIQSLDAGEQEPFQNMVLEDCWTNGVQGKLGSNLMAPIADLQDFLATQVGVSPQYARLLNYFVEEYGAGGHCDNLLEFMLKYGDKLIDSQEYGNALREGDTLRSPIGMRTGVTAQVDIAFDPNSRQPLMIVNKVYDRTGWLTARFAFGEESGQTFLRASMREWLKHVCGNCEPVDLVVNGECNDLQAHPRLTERVLRWHGESVIDAGSGVITPDQLRLRHNQDSGILELFDAAGKAISLVYLGSTVPSPSWGIPFALSILTQPYRLMRPGFAPPTEPDSEEIVFKARQQFGQLVLSRAVWWVRSDYLLREWFADAGAARLIKIQRECERVGFPAIMFAQAFPMSSVQTTIPIDILNSDRKPMWIDTRAPFCLSMLHRIAQRNKWIALTEMLPAPHDHWLMVNGERHVCEMQLEMIITANAADSPF